MKIRNHFEYKGYLGSAEIDTQNNLLYGKLLFISDLISYTASSAEELKKNFELAVDDYLEVCAEVGDQPDQPCKGSFNIRVGPDLHRKLNLNARAEGIGLNEYICQSLTRVVNKDQKIKDQLGSKIQSRKKTEPQILAVPTTARRHLPSR
jgi:predicted HicB family RNase H-like nuclease